jgi:anti-anti-sigma factor
MIVPDPQLLIAGAPIMRLKLEPTDASGVFRIMASGEIRQVHFKSADPLSDVIGAEGLASDVRFDMDRVKYVDSSGISWLIGCHKRCAAAGGKLTLCRVPPAVRQVLEFCALDRFLNIERDSCEKKKMAKAEERR